jgi:hypothetical protein
VVGWWVVGSVCVLCVHDADAVTHAVNLPFIETKAAVLDFAFDAFDDTRVAIALDNGRLCGVCARVTFVE